ncbi:MAG: hypothetical protein MK180_00955 [Rhodobacteraceae bacterium]|nr:hypothetical protein [Paracoccaceae bacterium]
MRATISDVPMKALNQARAQESVSIAVPPPLLVSLANAMAGGRTFPEVQRDVIRADYANRSWARMRGLNLGVALGLIGTSEDDRDDF